MISYFIKGGILMYPLLACSIFSLAIIIERFIFYHTLSIRQRKLYHNIKKLLKNRDITAATNILKNSRCSLGDVLKNIFQNYLLGKQAMREIAKESIAYETPKLEKYLQFLSAIASISTLLGFTGTVFGMINAFESIALHGVSSPSIVARGISEALITTAFGLMIAIPSAAFYYFFTYKVDRIISEIDLITTEIISEI